jgi:hypothetical protein
MMRGGTSAVAMPTMRARHQAAFGGDFVSQQQCAGTVVNARRIAGPSLLPGRTAP